MSVPGSGNPVVPLKSAIESGFSVSTGLVSDKP